MEVQALPDTSHVAITELSESQCPYLCSGCHHFCSRGGRSTNRSESALWEAAALGTNVSFSVTADRARQASAEENVPCGS